MSGFNFPSATTSFSAPATSAPTFSFGTPIATAAVTSAPNSFNFGMTTTSSAAAPSFNFGTGQAPSLGMGGPATSAVAGNAPSFGTNNPSTGAGAGGFSFGAPTPAAVTTASSLGISGFAFGSSTLAPKTTAFTLGTVTTSTPSGILGTGSAQPTTESGTTNASIGLGGISLTSSLQKSEQKSDFGVKENKAPQEILKTVDDLKLFIKQQKSISSEIARTSVRKLSNVSNSIDKLIYELQEISDSIQNKYTQIKFLRIETSKAIQNVEMAKQTSETPSSYQYENTAPMKYFHELAQKFENDLFVVRKQIESTEKQLRIIFSPQALTPEDIQRGLQQIHECFIALAGRLHEIHREVENCKEQHINLRAYLTNQTDDPFADIDFIEHESEVSKIGSGGPSPFSMLAGINLGKFGGTNNGGNSNTVGTGTIAIGGANTIGGFGKPSAIGNSSSSAFGINTLSGFGTGNVGGLAGLGSSNLYGVEGDGMIGSGGLTLEKPPTAKRTKQ